MLAFPDFFGEGIFVAVDYGFDGVFHGSKSLICPKIPSGIGKVIIFE
jgi:hypothetical protein